MVSGAIELFFLAVLIPLLWATFRARAGAKSLPSQRILLLSLTVSTVTDGVCHLLPDPASPLSRLLASASFLSFAVFVTALFFFTVFAIGEKGGRIPSALKIAVVAFASLLSVTSALSLFGVLPLGVIPDLLLLLPLAVSAALTLIFLRTLGGRNAAPLLFYTLLPIVALPLEILFTLPFLRAAGVVSLLVIEFSISKQEQYEIVEQARDLAEKQLELNKSQTRIMISQIQPHFLYNSLATIGYVCRKDAETASKALDAFAEYLRMNLTAITSEATIPFKDELEHIKTYLWLEKMRFEERLNTVFVIDATDFCLPALSVQPLVENAVKHGLCEKENGGTLTVRTIEYVDSFVIQIEDDGVGFDVDRYADDGRMHVGIANVRSRLKTMCDATLEIRSVKNKGTTATIRLPKEKQNVKKDEI